MKNTEFNKRFRHKIHEVEWKMNLLILLNNVILMLHGAISDQNLKCNISCNGTKKAMVPRSLNATYLAMATKNKRAKEKKKCNISCNAHKKMHNLPS